MTQIMTPSPITDPQIEKSVGMYRTMLTKHRAELGSKQVQHVLGTPEFVKEMLGVLRRRVLAISKMIARTITPNYDRTPEETLVATKRKQYVTTSVVSEMPKGKPGEKILYFFKPEPEDYTNGLISDDMVEKLYTQRGLVAVDPYALADFNTANPEFADTMPHGTHWKNSKGQWCYETFRRWRDGRNVNVHCSALDWHDTWWFVGVREQPLESEA